MLKFFRKHARGWFMLGIIVIIIIVFVLYFGSNRGSKSADAIAIIDGKVISEAEFHNEYGKLLDMARMRYGASMTPEMIKKMDIKKMAYDSLLNRQIIIAKAADLKVQISDEELRNAIMSLPSLQTDGVFDERKYQQLLRYNKMSAEDFENMQRIDLTANKIENLIREGIKISDKEIFDVYAAQNQKIDVAFIQVSAKDIKKKIAPTEAELEAYLKNNSNRFHVSEQVKIRYLSFSGSDFAPAIVNDSDIRDYYNRQKDKYKTKDGKQAQLADVKGAVLKELMKLRGMQNAYDGAKKAHDIIYQEDNFEAYAAKNKLRITNLDFFPVNRPPAEFAAVKELAAMLMDLKKNDVSKIITTDNGYYLIQVIEKKAAYLPKLANIRNDVKDNFEENEKQMLAEKEAFTILESLKKGEALDKVAKERGLKISETGLFQPGNTIPKLGISPVSIEALLQLTPSKPYPEKPFLINSNYVIFKFKNSSSIEAKDFEAKKDLYKKAFLSMKRDEALQMWLEGNKESMKREGRIKIRKEAKDL
jgi:peptidyl-prolyl cis-trans isomerase D